MPASLLPSRSLPLLAGTLLMLWAGCGADAETPETAPSTSPASAGTRMNAPNTLSAEERADGWQLLFDGDSLSDHWRGFKRDDVPAGWRAEDGTLAFDPEANDGGDLITREQYDDYEFALDWKISEGGNSGVIYNVSEEYDQTWETGPEMQILDNERHPDAEVGPDRRAGANYDLYPPEPESAVRPAGEWNEARIVMNGDHVEHWLNGEQVVAYDLGSDAWNERLANSKFAEMAGYAQNDSGYIALQDHGDRVWYRNIKIRPISGSGQSQSSD